MYGSSSSRHDEATVQHQHVDYDQFGNTDFLDKDPIFLECLQSNGVEGVTPLGTPTHITREVNFLNSSSGLSLS